MEQVEESVRCDVWHAQRREGENIGRRILRLKLPGRRPKRKFLDLVKGDMKLVGVREDDAEDMVAVATPEGTIRKKKEKKINNKKLKK